MQHKQGRAGQGGGSAGTGAGQGRAGQGRAGQGRAGQGRAGQGRATARAARAVLGTYLIKVPVLVPRRTCSRTGPGLKRRPRTEVGGLCFEFGV